MGFTLEGFLEEAATTEVLTAPGGELTAPGEEVVAEDRMASINQKHLIAGIDHKYRTTAIDQKQQKRQRVSCRSRY